MGLLSFLGIERGSTPVPAPAVVCKRSPHAIVAGAETSVLKEDSGASVPQASASFRLEAGGRLLGAHRGHAVSLRSVATRVPVGQVPVCGWAGRALHAFHMPRQAPGGCWLWGHIPRCLERGWARTTNSHPDGRALSDGPRTSPWFWDHPLLPLP